MENNEGIYLLSAEVQNFKGVKHQVIDFGHGNVWLLGGNGVGKSSIIDALRSPLDSKYIPQKPIHGDEERGIITLYLEGYRRGEKEEWVINHVFTPSNRTGRISLTRNGQKVKGSEKTIIQEIFGRVSFSIVEFLNSDKKERVKILKALTGCEDVLNTLDQQRSEMEMKRKLARKNLDDKKAVNDRTARPFKDEDIDKYKEKVDTSSLETQLSEVNTKAEKWNEVQRKLDKIKSIIADNNVSLRRNTSDIEDYEKQIEELRKKISQKKEGNEALTKANEEYSTKVEAGDKWLTDNPKPSSEALINTLSSARENNRMFDIIEQYRMRQHEILAIQKEYETLDEDIKKLDKQKLDTIASSQLPVQGLMFTDDEITLDNIPIEQINTQKQLELSVDIAIAMNPALKLIMIQEGSLFDKAHLEKVLHKIQSKGYHWICEYVQPNGGDLEIKYQEREI